MEQREEARKEREKQRGREGRCWREEWEREKRVRDTGRGTEKRKKSKHMKMNIHKNL